MHIYMQSKAPGDSNPKYCQLILTEDLFEGWTFTREWGRQNASRRVGKTHYLTYGEAEEVLLGVRDKQLADGYQVMFVQGDSVNGLR